MKLLALETSTDACSVALWQDGEIIESLETGIKHSSHILPMVEQLLAQAQLDLGQLQALAYGQGPGSFTGLRIGAGVVQGLGFARDLPVVQVSSLAALAQGSNSGHIVTAQDARMQQIYWARYLRNAQGLVELQGEEQLLAPQDVTLSQGGQWTGIGSGWEAYHAVLQARLGSAVTAWQPGRPLARDIALLAQVAYARGESIAAEDVSPVYLRDKVAQTVKEREAT